jgi:hypothetical protein
MKIIYGRVKRIGDTVVMAYFKVLFQQSYGGIDKIRGKCEDS